ncbi:glycoside hydrolase family 11 protein, partial [Ruminococcus albus]|uniref:glycoside hydrolase family 11 protein n=1 Tax=Ruminococcus albus TaxID=1264 RepID=UPI001A9A4928
MKTTVSKRIISALVSGVLMATPIMSAVTASAAKTLTTSPSHTQEVGWYNDYHHEIWQADTPNSSTMTLHDNDGGFSTQWKCGPNNSRGNFLARRGLYWGLNNPKTYKDYKPFYCDYDCSWYAGSSGNSRICIYGWAQNPLVEYYIIEDWKNWSPAQDGSAQYKGQTTIDGSVYKVYTTSRNSYTIEGNKNFTQYISIRQNLRTKGTISVSEHFKVWESMGMKMGNLYEVAFNVEGWESDGQADVTLNMYEGESGYHPDPEPEESEIEGTLYSATFENGTNYWSGRGSASVASSSSKAYEGSKSLYVSGRTDNWNGGEVEVNTSTFKPGNSYSFSAMVNPAESTTVQLSMQYDQNGTTKYTQIAEGSCTAGKWTKLENTNFTIPSGASNVKMYVEAPDSLCDIYVDRAIIADKGYVASGDTPVYNNANVPSNVKMEYNSQYKQM